MCNRSSLFCRLRFYNNTSKYWAKKLNVVEARNELNGISSCVPVSVASSLRWFDIYVIELTKLIVRIRGNLSKLERKVIVALVTTDVHARDIIDELYENKARGKVTTLSRVGANFQSGLKTLGSVVINPRPPRGMDVLRAGAILA